MARGRKGNEEKIKKFLAKTLKNKNSDVYNSSGKPSPSKIQEMLKKEIGIDITRQTVSKYLADDLTPYLIDIDFSQNSKIRDIKSAMNIAKGLYESDITKAGDKTKALNSWKQLNQQLIDYEKHLRELEMRKFEANKPNYLIKIEPGCAEQTCPKCGNKFYTNLNEDNNNELENENDTNA